MTGATPIDANGNSLAGLSEGAQEAIYSAIDTNTMGVSRNFPIALGPIQPGQTQSAIPDYFTSSDDNIWQGVVADSIHNNTSLLVDIELGDTITITWQYTLRGTITAIFQVIKDNKTGYLTLQWRSAEKNGKPINRDGSAAKGNPNTSGSGSGGDRVGGFGPNGSRYDLQTDAGNICASTTSIAIDGITVGYWAGIVPC